MRHFNLFFLFSLFNIAINVSNTYRILGVFPFGSRSHNNVFESITKALARHGHQVDVISHYDLKTPIKNYTRIISLEGIFKKISNSWDANQAKQVANTEIVDLIVRDCGNKLCDLLGLKGIEKFLKNLPNDPAYDLVITEAAAENCFFGLGFALKVPVVGISTLLQFSWFDESIGNPIAPGLAVSLYMENAEISTFWDRLRNTFLTQFARLKFYQLTEKYQTEAMRKHLTPEIPNIREIERNVSLIFVNTYQSLFGIRPNTPALIPIGGIQVEQNDEKISSELKNWMDESKEGVVFFTLGSMVIVESLMKDKIFSLYASFAKISPVRVLMKIKDRSKLPPGLPDNVLPMPWIPQIPVLRHKNTRIFITHCGLNSINEAMYFGVPMIGIPLFGDQMMNINLLMSKNLAVKLNYEQMTEKHLDEALNKLLYDPKYEQAAKRASRLFRDRQMSATETAIFWIEYIIRNGADSLKSPAIDLYWHQLELLDVYGILILATLVIIYVSFLILKISFHMLKYIFSLRFRFHKKKD
ncbi:UDP-glycosyltransferase UGT5-like [Leptopilina heterotoma]|uniref:UDP-glycosyltransferase UGT5-like n=1 Tax=Leptopilina heterotoma TaxID=63436 RepID=UPI001CA91396|nr:UDP-glycosyltransferase UGT5-like [Leptopilina heterotoma]XP_043467688.1 UDP-glycosyltransferase UGT5-like [Leptopilina heterotoma]